MSNRRYSFLPLFFLIVLAYKAVFANGNLINFGGPGDQANQASYYLASDSETPKVEPTEELKRSERSFWKKLFRNGWFGQDECNSCYDAGNGKNYNQQLPTDPAFPVFQPFRHMPQWRPFQPLFGGNCQRCKPQEYNYNNPSYDNNQNLKPPYLDSNPVQDNSYGSSEQSGQENPSYSAPEVPSPIYNDNSNVDNSPPGSVTYESPSPTSSPKLNDNNAYSQSSSYEKGEVPTKIPQILYQPIIYVSPQLKDCGLLKANTNEPSYGEQQSPEFKVPCQQYLKNEAINYNNSPQNALCTTTTSVGGNPNTVSTVSTTYTVITPSKMPNENLQTGPSKYSLLPIGSPSYGDANPSSPATPACIPPLIMTTDDQPYRTCPELFDEYNRYLNKISPYGLPNIETLPNQRCSNGPLIPSYENAPIQHGNIGSVTKPGNTFINAQLINI